MTRDAVSGENVSFADVQIAGRSTTSTKHGLYEIGNLPPGRYTLTASYAGQPITVTNVEIDAGLATYVDVSFTLGEVSPIVIDFGDPRASEIQRFTTKQPRIEGTVSDSHTRARVPGAVVTAARGVDDETLQAVTDDHGRYRFDGVDPGTYAISAYYSPAAARSRFAGQASRSRLARACSFRCGSSCSSSGEIARPGVAAALIS
jgi:Carboxypeptidase regulatory-like domain